MTKYRGGEITGNLDIIIVDEDSEFEGEIEKWQEVLIHGDPEGLRSLAKLLIRIADTNQESDNDLPTGAREHFHLRPKLELANSSVPVIVGRLDGKGNGAFYDSFIPRENKKDK